MSNLFHYALHIVNSERILNKIQDFYQNVLGGDAGINNNEHAFAKVFNTILAFEPQADSSLVVPHRLDFLCVPKERIASIQKYCDSHNISYKQDEQGNISLKDPAGNHISIEIQNLSTQNKPERVRVYLTATDLDKTRAYYQSHFGCKIKESDNGMVVDFFDHELVFEQGQSIEKGFVLNEAMIQQAKVTQLISTEHYGITDLSKDHMNQLIKDFNQHEGFVLDPMIGNRGTELEQIYAFTQDPSGYVVELRYIKNLNFSMKNVDKIAQQNVTVIKEKYQVEEHSPALLHQFRRHVARDAVTQAHNDDTNERKIVSNRF